MLFYHTQGFTQEAWFQALKLFKSHLRPDLHDDVAIHFENWHLNELVVLKALGRVLPSNERFAREKEDWFPVLQWPALRASDQYHPPAHHLLCWDLQADMGIVMHQKRFYLLDFASARLTLCGEVPESRTFTNTPPGTVLKGFSRQAALSALACSFQHLDQRFPDLQARQGFFIHCLLEGTL